MSPGKESSEVAGYTYWSSTSNSRDVLLHYSFYFAQQVNTAAKKYVDIAEIIKFCSFLNWILYLFCLAIAHFETPNNAYAQLLLFFKMLYPSDPWQP